MAAWLFKTEPSDYSFADLVRDKSTTWSGVSNATALIHLRKVAKGDTVVVYHTGNEKQVIGLAKVMKGAYPDPALGDPKRVVVDIAPGSAFASPVSLAAFRADPVLRETELIRITRLSIVPLDARQLARVVALGRG
jgi:predicted RNA-binding protein with PUA-like domain